jgi:hypothetical protein
MSYLTDDKSLLGAESPEDVALFKEGHGPLTSNIAETGVFTDDALSPATRELYSFIRVLFVTVIKTARGSASVAINSL